MKDIRNEPEPRRRRILVGVAAATLIAIAATSAAAERPNEKACPGFVGWDVYVTSIFRLLGLNPGEWIVDNCL